jgi:transposase
MDRRQTAMFTPTLDAVVSQDHPVRLFDEILAQMDWSAWECHYVLVAGQPPIHPRVMAGVILYGLSRGLRSSRALEWACLNSVDFLWLAEGRDIDHSTFCLFRTRFRQELKDLFRQIGRLAMAMGLIRLNQVALDGTKVQANSSRHGTATAGTLERRLAELDAQVEGMLAAAEEADRKEDGLFGGQASPNRLPRELSDLKRRQARLRLALAAARRKQQERGECEESKRPKVPVADPDSTVQPNKEGGYAPNYVPMAAVDGQKGMIVEADVLPDSDEGGATVETVDRVEEGFGRKPEQLLADGAHGSGTNLAELQERGVEGFIPLGQREDTLDNPARRSDPTQPVAADQWEKLPRNTRTKKWDRSAFLYDSGRDCYWCPMGRRLDFAGMQDKHRDRGAGVYRLYRCGECVGCPQAGECVAGKREFRTVSRDQHEPLREAMDAKMRSPEGRKTYARRKWIAETPFAVLKTFLRLRQFLLRGLEKVKIEWLWACTAFNLRKLTGAVGAMRIRLAALAA